MNVLDLWQFTPLHEAASKARDDVCTLLLCHGANPTIMNCHQKIALDLAPTEELRKKIDCKPCSRHLSLVTFLSVLSCPYLRQVSWPSDAQCCRSW